jgi:signal transduction histidine kinase
MVTDCRILTIIISTLTVFCVAGQKFDPATIETKLLDLTDRERVEYINKNYYTIYSGSLPNAEKLLDWAIMTAQKNQWSHEEAYALLHQGVVLYLTGRYPDAHQVYLKALSIFESLNDKAGMAATHNELAVFYHKQKDPKNSNRSLDIAEQLAREINDLEKLGTTLGNRGAILSVQGRLKEAQPYFLEVYKIRVQQKDSVGLGYVLLDLAEIALHEGDLKKCIQFTDESTAIREKIKDHYGVTVNLVFKGEMYFRAGFYQNAIDLLKNGLEASVKIKYPDLTSQAADLLSKVYQKAGDPDQALRYHHQHDQIQDSLLSVENAKVIKELQAKYETEKKELQIIDRDIRLNRNQWIIASLTISVILIIIIGLFWRRNSIILKNKQLADQAMRYQESLTSSVINSQEAERSRIAVDLHDGLGQLITSAQIQARALQKKELAELLDQMHKEIRSIAFDLHPKALSDYGLIAGLQELSDRVNAQTGCHLDTLVSGEIRMLEISTSVAIYRICQEWFSNLLKHGEASNITLQVSFQPDGLSIIIESDGVGFDPDILYHSAGNGWKNILTRTKQLEGEVYVDSINGKTGSTLIANFPI